MAINPLIAQTISFSVYEEGTTRLLGLASIDLPEVNFTSTELKGAGIAGEISVPTRGSTENLELTLHWQNIFEQPLRLFRNRSVSLELRAAIETYDEATGILKSKAIKIVARGLPASLNLGKLEPSELGEIESKVNLTYLKLQVDGKKLLELDKTAYIYEIDGEDFLEDVRSALGL